MRTDLKKQKSRDETIAHCKKWANIARTDGIDLLVNDKGAAIGIADLLAYTLETQEWIDPVAEPELNKVCEYAVAVDSDHTDRASWETLLALIDRLE